MTKWYGGGGGCVCVLWSLQRESGAGNMELRAGGTVPTEEAPTHLEDEELNGKVLRSSALVPTTPSLFREPEVALGAAREPSCISWPEDRAQKHEAQSCIVTGIPAVHGWTPCAPWEVEALWEACGHLPRPISSEVRCRLRWNWAESWPSALCPAANSPPSSLLRQGTGQGSFL